MSFDMAHVRLTTAILHELTEEVKAKFYRSQQVVTYKQKLRKIFPIFRIVWKPRASFRARAWCVNINFKKVSERVDFKLSKLIHPYTQIGANEYFMLIEVEASGVKFVNRQKLANLVSHELAHLLQISIKQEIDAEGKYSMTNEETDHEPLWQNLHKAMGGDAETSVAI